MTDLQRQTELAKAITPYRAPLEEFVRGQISADDFERRYTEAYLNDEGLDCSDETFEIVDRFFADVDAYVSEPRLRDSASGDLGPEELRKLAEQLLAAAGIHTTGPNSE